MRRLGAMTIVTFFARAPGTGVAITVLAAFSAWFVRSGITHEGGFPKDTMLERFMLAFGFAWLAVAVSEICMRYLEKSDA